MSDPILSDLLNQHDPERPPRPTAFDYLTKLVLPVLALVALILTRSQKQTVLTLGLLVFAFISLVAGFYPEFSAWAKEKAQARMDSRTAKRTFPALKKFVARFGEFVDPSGASTVHGIAESEVQAHDSGLLMARGLPPIGLFYDLWANLSRDVDSQPPNVASLTASLRDLSTLVSLYGSFCMRPVFELLPQKLRAEASGLPKQVEEQVDWERMGRKPPGQLTDSARRSLEACRERFTAFLNDYERFLEGFEAGFAERHLSTRTFPRVKPL